jgi:hypothetical protein
MSDERMEVDISGMSKQSGFSGSNGSVAARGSNGSDGGVMDVDRGTDNEIDVDLDGNEDVGESSRSARTNYHRGRPGLKPDELRNIDRRRGERGVVRCQVLLPRITLSAYLFYMRSVLLTP